MTFLKVLVYAFSSTSIQAALITRQIIHNSPASNPPKDMMLHDLVDHKAELRNIYSRISTSGLLAGIHSRIDGLVDVTSNSASEKIFKQISLYIYT